MSNTGNPRHPQIKIPHVMTLPNTKSINDKDKMNYYNNKSQ